MLVHLESDHSPSKFTIFWQWYRKAEFITEELGDLAYLSTFRLATGGISDREIHDEYYVKQGRPRGYASDAIKLEASNMKLNLNFTLEEKVTSLTPQIYPVQSLARTIHQLARVIRRKYTRPYLTGFCKNPPEL